MKRKRRPVGSIRVDAEDMFEAWGRVKAAIADLRMWRTDSDYLVTDLDRWKDALTRRDGGRGFIETGGRIAAAQMRDKRRNRGSAIAGRTALRYYYVVEQDARSLERREAFLESLALAFRPDCRERRARLLALPIVKDIVRRNELLRGVGDNGRARGPRVSCKPLAYFNPHRKHDKP